MLDDRKENVAKPNIVTFDLNIDAEPNARPGREVHDRAEFAKSKSKVEATKTVSMDTNFFCRIPSWPCQMAWRVCFLGASTPPNPSQPPIPMRPRGRARCSSARRPNGGMG